LFPLFFSFWKRPHSGPRVSRMENTIKVVFLFPFLFFFPPLRFSPRRLSKRVSIRLFFFFPGKGSPSLRKKRSPVSFFFFSFPPSFSSFLVNRPAWIRSVFFFPSLFLSPDYSRDYEIGISCRRQFLSFFPLLNFFPPTTASGFRSPPPFRTNCDLCHSGMRGLPFFPSPFLLSDLVGKAFLFSPLAVV